MTARPKVQIIRTDDGVSFYLNGKCLDETTPTRNACYAAESIAKELARALGADVEDAAEPDAQPYTYFIAYDWTGVGVHGVGYCWLTRPGAIESAADTDDIVARIREKSPKMRSVMITNFICTDGPS